MMVGEATLFTRTLRPGRPLEDQCGLTSSWQGRGYDTTSGLGVKRFF